MGWRGLLRLGPSGNLLTGSVLTCLGIFGAHRHPTATALAAGSSRFSFSRLLDAAPRSREDFAPSTPGFPAQGQNEKRKPRQAGRGGGLTCRVSAAPESAVPRGLSPPSEDPVCNFQLKSATRRPPQPRRALPCRPRALWLRGPVAPSRSGSAAPTSRSARLQPARGPSSPASEQDAPQGVRLLSSPNFDFPSDTTPSLERAPASASLHPRSLQPSRGKMKCPARGAPPGLEKPFHSPRVRLDPPPATSGQMIFTLGRARVEGPGSWGGRKGGGSAELLGCSRAPLAARG